MKSTRFLYCIIGFLIIMNFSCRWIKEGERENEKKEMSDTTKKKFTGEKKHYWENSKLKASIQYVDGLREGINKNYSRDEKLLSVVPFSKGMINGESIQYYPDGTINSKINYVNDIKHGAEQWFYENSRLYQQSNYSEGKLDGIQYKYYKDGTLMSEAPYKKGQPGIGLKEYNKDGSLKKMPKIVVTETNNIKSIGEYVITFTLSDKSASVKFYAGELTDETYLTPYLSTIPTKNGTGKSVINVKKGTFIMYTLNVVAKKKTYFRNEYITQKKVNIAIENR